MTTRTTFSLFILALLLGPIVTSAQTDSWPRIVSKPALQFPNEAYMGRVVGKVWVKIFVGTDGVPIKTDILKREPEMAYLFDNEARKWGMGCRFTAAPDSSEYPAPVWVTIPLSFALDHFAPAICVIQAEPEYPLEARKMGMEGWVGLAVLIKGNGEVDMSQVIVVAREPINTSIFEKSAKEAAYHSQYRPAAFEHNTVEGWCFIKVSFKLESNEPK